MTANKISESRVVYGKTTGGQRHKFEVYCDINSIIDQTADEGDGEGAMEGILYEATIYKTDVRVTDQQMDPDYKILHSYEKSVQIF